MWLRIAHHLILINSLRISSIITMKDEDRNTIVHSVPVREVVLRYVWSVGAEVIAYRIPNEAMMAPMRYGLRKKFAFRIERVLLRALYALKS